MEDKDPKTYITRVTGVVDAMDYTIDKFADKLYVAVVMQWILNLQLALVVLQMSGVIDLPLWWILAPLWLPIAAALVIAVVMAIFKVVSKSRNG